MNVRNWINLFIFIKETLKHPSLKKARQQENRVRSLYLLSFLGMFIFAMIMTEQAIIYSNLKHSQDIIISNLNKEILECSETIPYYDQNGKEIINE